MKVRIATIRRLRCRACAAAGNACAEYDEGRIAHDDPAASCPRKIWDMHHGEGGVAPPPAPVPAQPLPPGGYLAMWRAIHTLALEDKLTPETLAEITRGLPGCCAPIWAAWMAAHPLPMTGQFAWSVDAHNDVRRRQNKPELTVAEAREEWSAQRSTIPRVSTPARP